MPGITKYEKAFNLPCADGEGSFVVRYMNWGEPFREGIEIGIQPEHGYPLTVTLDDREAKMLRDHLNQRYPTRATPARESR